MPYPSILVKKGPRLHGPGKSICDTAAASSYAGCAVPGDNLAALPLRGEHMSAAPGHPTGVGKGCYARRVLNICPICLAGRSV